MPVYETTEKDKKFLKNLFMFMVFFNFYLLIALLIYNISYYFKIGFMTYIGLITFTIPYLLLCYYYFFGIDFVEPLTDIRKD